MALVFKLWSSEQNPFERSSLPLSSNVNSSFISIRQSAIKVYIALFESKRLRNPCKSLDSFFRLLLILPSNSDMSQASSRYAQSQNISAAVCDAFLKRENAHRTFVSDNMAYVVNAAPRLRQDGGELQETLMAMVRYIDDDTVLSAKEVNDFLQEARDRLKGIAEMNIENDRNIAVFSQAVKALKQVEVANFDQGQDRTDEEMGDPGERLKEIYAQKKIEEEQKKLDLNEEKHYRQVCEELGEKIGGGDDDEIEVQYNMASQRNLLTCPITTTLMENPVKNKVCGHVYSRDGIENYIQQRRRSRLSCPCPVPGCGNGNLTPDQLETDLRTEQMVKRERRRLDHEKELRSQSQTDLVYSDEE